MHQEGIGKRPENYFWGHLAIAVGSRTRVDSITEILRNNAVPVITEPRTTGDGFYESTISDPEGNLIEITI